LSEVRNVIIAVLIVNSLAIGGILYEIGYFDEDESDVSTIVTAKLVIKFKTKQRYASGRRMEPLIRRLPNGTSRTLVVQSERMGNAIPFESPW